MSALSQAIFNQLANSAALTTLLGGANIFNKQAPDLQALPYVIFSMQGGGDQNINPWRLKNVLYFVRGFATTDVAAGQIDAQIDALLHKKKLTITGWCNFQMQRETDMENITQEPNGENIYMAGGMYRVRLSK